MFGRSIRALALALGLLAALAPPALAGGWAVTTLDGAPAVFRAGQSQTVGFTIRQHGVTPVRAEQLGGEVAVGDGRGRALWIEGEPHLFFYRDRDGQVRDESVRLAGNVLLWERGELTLRLEGAIARDEAIRIAASVG